ncbi:c-type cytochrome [Danxiaibacter flavus]|uniref:C-type cytochrome n=1 Tax=Danxiaibacter flavus TaxID=3049108 RepID=A0ABV3ZHA1_9BACT|nr:c-type cytochrome [Chitinophagaceae bacterium DXS]
MLKTLYLIAAGAVMLASCQQKTETTTSGTGTISHDSLIKRGSYLVNMMACTDCHTPKKMGPNGPEPDPALLLSGHPSGLPLPKIDTAATKDWAMTNMHNTAWVGPWGVSFTANLTPDETGIGSWTEAQFFKAIREGKSKGLDGNRALLPPMPWPSYAQASDDDLKAIFAYLKSIKPVKNVVPQPIPPTQLASLK